MIKEEKITRRKRAKRMARTRKQLRANIGKLRLSVFASNQHFYAQLIDDVKGETVLYISEKDLKESVSKKIEKAAKLGEIFAKLAKEKKLKNIIFDKGRYKYHGRVKAFADAVRAGGVEF